MNSSPFTDRRANGLLNRVREDVSHLREDIGNLLSHTTKKTLPNGARDLAEQAKHQLAASGAYAASRLRDFRRQPPRQSAGWVGGAMVVGLLAYGAYALCQKCCQNKQLADSTPYEPEDEVAG
jgi:uncharacterized membrane protein YebE (DUF533 family)